MDNCGSFCHQGASNLQLETGIPEIGALLTVNNMEIGLRLCKVGKRDARQIGDGKHPATIGQLGFGFDPARAAL